MSKVTDEGLLPPDGPIFSRGILISPARGSKRSMTTPQPGTDGAQQQEAKSPATSKLSPEDQKIWDEAQKQLDQEMLEGMRDQSSTGAVRKEEAEQQISTREQQIVEACGKMIAENVKLGGRRDDHPLIIKWRTELGVRRRANKYLDASIIAAGITAVILAFLGLWGPAGIVAVLAMILFAIATRWQLVEHRSVEETGGGEDSEDRKKTNRSLEEGCMSDVGYKVPPYSKEEFGEIKLIPYEPPEPDPPTSLTPENLERLHKLLEAGRKGGEKGVREEYRRQNS